MNDKKYADEQLKKSRQRAIEKYYEEQEKMKKTVNNYEHKSQETIQKEVSKRNKQLSPYHV